MLQEEAEVDISIPLTDSKTYLMTDLMNDPMNDPMPVSMTNQNYDLRQFSTLAMFCLISLIQSFHDPL